MLLERHTQQRNSLRAKLLGVVRIIRRRLWPLRFSSPRLHGRGILKAGVNAMVDDVEERRVLIAALHLLPRRISLRITVGAAIVGPALFCTMRKSF
jgi:hypothetical protein